MKDLNKAMLTGYLGADPELRYTPQGSAVCSFRVGSGRSWRDQSGNPHDDTEWFRIVAWDKLGEICHQYLTKGTRVYIEGRLQTRKWQDKDGQDRYTTEVIASDMIILSSKDRPAERDDEPGDDDVLFPQRPAAPAPTRPAAPAAPTRAAGVRKSSVGAVRNVPQPIDNDEDLPF